MRVVAVFVAALVLAGAAVGKPPRKKQTDPFAVMAALIVQTIKTNPCIASGLVLPSDFAKRWGIPLDKHGHVDYTRLPATPPCMP